MSIFSNANLTFIQQHASNTLPSPPSPNLFTLPSPFDPNRPIHRPYDYQHPTNDSCSISSIELRPLMKRNIITPAVLASSSDHCRLPSLQNMLASPPPEDRPSNTTSSHHNNTHDAKVTSFHRDQQPIASHLVKRGRSNDAAVIIHEQQQHDTFTQKKSKHRHHDDTRGLRHFSKQVCDTVARKGITTYNEVADELASSIRASSSDNASCTTTSLDQKNIRRRVYDALNVLMGTGIIAKDKKNIKWVGDIACTDEHVAHDMHGQHLDHLQAQIHREQVHQATLVASLDEMSHLIRDKLQQHVQLCHLIWRNQQRNDKSTPSPPNHARVELPFFLVSSLDDEEQGGMQIQVRDDGHYAEISDISMAHGEARIIYEDVDVLESLGLNNITHEQLDAWLPNDPALRAFVSVRRCSGGDGTIVCLQSSRISNHVT